MKKLSFLRQHVLRISMSLGLLLLLLLNDSALINLGFVQKLENYTYDLRLLWTMPGTLDKRIVIVDLDEKSLQEQGHWPWPRNKLARMMDVLFDQYQIDVLGFDVIFPEHDDSSGWDTLASLARTELRADKLFAASLNKLQPSLQYDQIFADSFKNRRVVLGYYFHHDTQQTSKAGQVGELPAPALAQGTFAPAAVGAAEPSGFSANLAVLQQAAAAGGFFNASPLVDSDGVFRRISLLQMYRGALYETLSLAVTRLALRMPKLELSYAGDTVGAENLEALRLGRRRIPVDAEVAALVPYRGRQGSFVYVSASDVLQGKVARETLHGAIVLVGTTAPGLLDLRSTPVGEVYPGVELHANMVAAMMDGNIQQRPPYTYALELLGLFSIGIVLAFALPALSPLRAIALVLAISAALIGANLYAWQAQQFILPLASGLVLIAGLFIFNMSYGFFVDSRAKRLLAGLFGQYVPPELVDEMAQDPAAYSLQGESRELTVLFSDVRGFTTISEGLDPQQLTKLMNEFLTPMTKVIHRHRGTIDKYMGDAIMAFWGAPVHDPAHARNALLAALQMVAELKILAGHFKQQGWPPIRVGIGLNTGEMTVGNMGSEFRLAYTAMGDAVNLGSRLESLTRYYDVDIIVSEFTRAAVPEHAFRELDCVRVKGKDKPVAIFEPLGLADQLSATDQQELAGHQSALSLYRQQRWSVAAQAFAQLRQTQPQRKLYQLYAQRIEHFISDPPADDWDGTYTFLTK